MTAHVRTQIRKAVQARLMASGVFSLVCGELRLLLANQDDDFPAAAVQVTESDTPVGRGQPGHRPIRRDMSVTVIVALRLDDADEEGLDALTVAVEQALADPSGLGIGSLLDWRPVATGSIQGGFAERGLAAIPVTFACAVTTAEGAPQTNIHA